MAFLLSWELLTSKPPHPFRTSLGTFSEGGRCSSHPQSVPTVCLILHSALGTVTGGGNISPQALAPTVSLLLVERGSVPGGKKCRHAANRHGVRERREVKRDSEPSREKQADAPCAGDGDRGWTLGLP